MGSYACLKGIALLLLSASLFVCVVSGHDQKYSTGTGGQVSTHMPLNFRDAIVRINNFVTLSVDYLGRQNQANFTADHAISYLYNVDTKTASNFFTFIQIYGSEVLNELLANSLQKLKNSNSTANYKSESNITAGCLTQLQQLSSGFGSRSNWAYRVLDAFGKPPSGILSGNLDWYGEFTECRNVSALNDTWFGRYALITKPIDPQDMFRPYSGEVNAIDDASDDSPQPLQIEHRFIQFLRYGVCVPSQCNSEDIAELINIVIDEIALKLNLSANVTDFKLNESWVQIQEPKSLDAFAISTLNLITIILIIIAVGTFYDVYKRYKHYIQCKEILSESLSEPNRDKDQIIESEHLYMLNLSHDPVLFQLLASFSVYTNTKRIFRTQTSDMQMRCLHGVRFLSLAWVILGHSFIFNLGYSDNLIVVGDYLKRFSFMIISNAFFSVDSFFLLSGLLTSYSFIREMERSNNNRLTIRFLLKYYLHRLWRLTPPYYMMIIISASLSPYFGLGPMYPQNGFETDKCQKQWWANILYINNFFDPKSMCFGIAWYLANDMQFHWIAPIMVIPFAFNKRRLGMVLCSLFLIANIIAIAVVLSTNEGIELAQFSQKFGDFFQKFYIMPWCRIGPFVIGIVLGYFVILFKKKKYLLKLDPLTNLFAWAISITLCSLVVFGLYPDVSSYGHSLSRTTHIIYQCFSRIVWSMSLGYMIYACITSNGGIVNKFLSLPIWVPLSKLTYSAYLVHTIVILYFNATQEHPMHIQDSSMIYYFLSTLFVSYFWAYFISIFFELPIIGIEKYLFRRSGPQPAY